MESSGAVECGGLPEFGAHGASSPLAFLIGYLGRLKRKGAWKLLTVLPFSWKCELVRIIIAGALRRPDP